MTPTHPDFDAELAPVLVALLEQMPGPMTIGQLDRLRAGSELTAVPLAVLQQQARVSERTIPGPDGAPDVEVLILSPSGT